MNESATYTPTQRQRLIELGARPEDLNRLFISQDDRNDRFERLSSDLRNWNLSSLKALQTGTRRTTMSRICRQLEDALVAEGFVQVATPSLISRGAIEKMGITEHDELWEQIFWLGKKRCLRPMLAPNLYFLLSHLQRLWTLPVRIFEIGSCWRRDSKGARHLEEFTMLNIVELGCLDDPMVRLEALAAMVMGSLGLTYDLETESSEVYGKTIDVVSDGVELGSGAVGPHPLDVNWHITEPWSGLGVGIERTAMIAGGHVSVHRVGRSLIYLDGTRLNI